MLDDRTTGDSAKSITVAHTAGERQAGHRNVAWSVIQVFCRCVFTTWLRYRARGVGNWPRFGGGLVLSNHQSFLDPLLIGLPLQRPVSFLARENLFRVPGIGWILRNTYVMPINRDSASTASVREMVSRIQSGYLVGIFPEGTRSDGTSVGTFKPGFTAVLRRAQRPVYPVGIAGAHRALGRGSWFLKPARVCVVFGEPIPFEALLPLTERGRESELLEFIRTRVIRLQTEAENWLRGGDPAEQQRLPKPADDEFAH